MLNEKSLHTSFTSLKMLTNSSLMAKLLRSISPRKFLRVRKLFSTKKVDSALRASNMSYIIDNKRILLGPFSNVFLILSKNLLKSFPKNLFPLHNPKNTRRPSQYWTAILFLKHSKDIFTCASWHIYKVIHCRIVWNCKD